jgi:acyl-CoA dehydrogenase
MSRFALQLLSQPSSTAKQMACCHRMIQKAVHDPARYGRVWKEHVAPLDGAYEMNR